MPELVRESSHENQISVLFMAEENVYRKISRTDSGRRLLNNEKEGIVWYADKVKSGKDSLKCSIWETDTFTRLDIKSISGKQVNYTNPITSSYPYLELCLDHYSSTWPREETVPCHGDLTLDNVIFSEYKHPIFFDWEHFYKKGECWGFDMAYLILSAIVLPKPNFIKLNQGEKERFLMLWLKLCDGQLQHELAVNPVAYFRNVFKGKDHWQTILGKSPNKLFPMWLNRKQEDYICAILKS